MSRYRKNYRAHPSYEDGAFVELAHDHGEILDSADRFLVDRDGDSLTAELYGGEDPAHLVSKARLIDLLDEHLECGGRLRLEGGL